MIIKTSDRLVDKKAYYFATKLKEIAAMNAEGMDIINLGIGSPDMLPPEEVLNKLKEGSSEPDANRYQSYHGLNVLRSAFSTFYQKHFNTKVNSDSEVLPLMGSKEGIMHISMAFLNPGDKVLVPNPGYPAYGSCTDLAGAETILYELTESNDWLPDLDALSDSDLSAVKIMWLNYPHMPTGAKASLEFFKRIIAFAHQHKILICHDNPYAFILNDEPLSIFQAEGAKEVCLELTSLSKCFNMAGWRVGAVIAKAEYLETILKFKSQMDSGMFKPIQEAAAIALNSDASWFSQLNERYKARRLIAYKIMDSLRCKYQKDGAGLFVWAKVPDSVKDVEEFINVLLDTAQVFITPGSIFGSAGARYIRISLCSEAAQLEMALARIQNRETENHG